MKKRKCYCHPPELIIKKVYTCNRCGGKIEGNMLTFRGDDDCSGKNGLTPFSGQFKIWKCNHYIYCPLCSWRCENIGELKHHLESMTDTKRSCDGFYYYGQYGVDCVLNELLYYEFYKIPHLFHIVKNENENS